MNEEEQYRNKEFIRFMNWIKENNALIENICGHDKDRMTMIGFRNIMSILHKESLYIPMFMFLMTYSDLEYVRLSINQMFIEMFIREWQTNKDTIYDELYDSLS